MQQNFKGVLVEIRFLREIFSSISFMFPECCSPQLEADLFDKQDLARAKVAALKVFFIFYCLHLGEYDMSVNVT